MHINVKVKVKLHKNTNHVTYHVKVYPDDDNEMVNPHTERQFDSYQLAYVFLDGLIRSRHTSAYEPYTIDPYTLISEAKVVYRNE